MYKKNTGKDFALFCNKSYFPFPTERTLDQTPWTRKLLGASSDILLFYGRDMFSKHKATHEQCYFWYITK